MGLDIGFRRAKIVHEDTCRLRSSYNENAPDHVLRTLGLPTLLEILGLEKNQEDVPAADMDWVTILRTASETYEVLHKLTQASGYVFPNGDLCRAAEEVKKIKRMATMFAEYPETMDGYVIWNWS